MGAVSYAAFLLSLSVLVLAQSDEPSTPPPTPPTPWDLIPSLNLPTLPQSALLPTLKPEQKHDSETTTTAAAAAAESQGQQNGQSPGGFTPSLPSNPSFPSLTAPVDLSQLALPNLSFPWTTLFAPLSAQSDAQDTETTTGLPSFSSFPPLPTRPSFTGTPPSIEPLSQFVQGLLGLVGARNPHRPAISQFE